MNNQLIDRMNFLGAKRAPFFFMIDYRGESGKVIPLDELDHNSIRFDFNGMRNHSELNNSHRDDILLKSHPHSLEYFQKAFHIVRDGLNHGDSFLTNLTMKTPVDVSVDLQTVFENVKAKYRLWYRNHFVCFSPEIFVQIKDHTISSFPMKGTIDANVPDAFNIIMNDPKELSEHFTIVDLIRNDLSSVSQNVMVEKFRYIDRVETQNGALLQVSSHIKGELEDDWHSNIGNIFNKLLPAGSITGAPKKRTCEIIEEAEKSKRGYYTGVSGIYDGESLDSMVMIRFIAEEGDRYFFHSGGGITAMSDLESEYEEMKNKIYVPIY
ncbi:aminodeoxychorismate synthase component I [Halosquirtibacter laminarini]|uniref:Aminodeoxychorismate synthase component I n=1 Tax=Halosquirtibacter laminarini TaxID=3374600 RepID=A0AC61NDR4_9BACT|nr:aminodeoxychorismate synthase component I [Prolixibacteraceae bacterium]